LFHPPTRNHRYVLRSLRKGILLVILVLSFPVLYGQSGPGSLLGKLDTQKITIEKLDSLLSKLDSPKFDNQQLRPDERIKQLIRDDHYSLPDPGRTDTVPQVGILSLNPRVYQSNDTVWIYSGICKTLQVRMLTGQPVQKAPPVQILKKDPLLTVHGNVQYEYLFRSFADTPFYQKDFRQHTIRASLGITVKDKYPININLVIRKSNSPYFKDFFDGGMVFDRFAYYKNMRQHMLEKIVASLPEQGYLDAAKKLLTKELDKLNLKKRSLGTNGFSQQLIEEREKLYNLKHHMPVVKAPTVKDNSIDSLKSILREKYNERRKELDSLAYAVQRLKHKIDSMENKLTTTIAQARQKINKATNPAELVKVGIAYGIGEKQKKFEKLIAGIRAIGIGRTGLNYSELTAKSISLTGLNLEYNSRVYLALTTGKIDYGFRDFFGKNTRSLKQHLVMGRIGIGNVEKRAIILSLFSGSRINYGAVLNDSATHNILLAGYSLETILRKDENTFLVAELAKSTRPLTGNFGENRELGSLFRFSDHSNIGISVKGQTQIPETATRFSGLFRKTGRNFQSFSLFNYNTDQTAWMIKADQSFLKDKINLAATVRRNDFVNPFTEKSFKTTTVFTSIQLSARIPKGPAINIGYYPGSQLYIIDKNRVRENVYYIMNGSVIHQYKVRGWRMMSSAIYNNYTTKGTDSGFINYRGTNYMFSQSVSSGRLQWQGNFIYTDQQELKFYSLETNTDYAVGKIRLAAGLKYNRIIDGRAYWGGVGQLVLETKMAGSLQLQYEKTFLPTIQRTLFPVEVGRLNWTKFF
jgi:hypothetical protein